VGLDVFLGSVVRETWDTGLEFLGRIRLSRLGRGWFGLRNWFGLGFNWGFVFGRFFFGGFLFFDWFLGHNWCLLSRYFFWTFFRTFLFLHLFLNSRCFLLHNRSLLGRDFFRRFFIGRILHWFLSNWFGGDNWFGNWFSSRFFLDFFWRRIVGRLLFDWSFLLFGFLLNHGCFLYRHFFRTLVRRFLLFNWSFLLLNNRCYFGHWFLLDYGSVIGIRIRGNWLNWFFCQHWFGRGFCFYDLFGRRVRRGFYWGFLYLSWGFFHFQI